MPRAAITRRVHFNAAHRLFNPRFSEEWNRQTFGDCSNPNFHGHNYELELTVGERSILTPGTSWTSIDCETWLRNACSGTWTTRT